MDRSRILHHRDKSAGANTAIIMKLPTSIAPILKKFSYGEHIHPGRDWFALLACAFVLMLVSAAWNLWLLKSVQAGAALGAPTEQTAFDTAPIESVRSVFESRKTEETKFKQEYRFVDPSL